MSWDPTLAPPTTTRQADDGWFDASRAHPARVYDYWLGGKDNFAARHQPGAKVVYLDNDPVVLAHARALLARDGTPSPNTATPEIPTRS